MSRPHPPIRLFKSGGLTCAGRPVGPSDTMRTFVCHNDIGLNFMETGRMRVLLSTGYRYVLGPGRLAVYWGAIPHKVEEYGAKSLLYWATLPLGTFLRWTVSKEFKTQLMRGRVFVEPDEQEGPRDLALLQRWRKTIPRANAETRAIVLLEMEARLRRLAQTCLNTRSRAPHVLSPKASSPGERMLLLIAEHFREPLSVVDVAAAVGLHPAYAGQVFRRHAGMRLNDYITECRLSHAKALLAAGEDKIMDVAIDAGFGSVSRFHAIFKRFCGCTPRAYRMGIQEPPG